MRNKLEIQFKNGKIDPELAQDWLRDVKWPNTTSKRLRKWLLLCEIGKTQESKSLLNTYIEKHLVKANEAIPLIHENLHPALIERLRFCFPATDRYKL